MKTTEKQIQLFNIPAQHEPIKEELQNAVLNVLDSYKYILGDQGTAFEKEFANAMGTTYAVGVSSGTSALHLAVQALDLRPGEAVLTSPFTFIGTTIGILSAGASIQFCDIDDTTLTLDPNEAMIDPISYPTTPERLRRRPTTTAA